MRRARIKVSAEEGEAVYHCMTRVVNGEKLLDEVAREVLRQQLWQVAFFCGVQVITYAILPNHFHVLVRVPKRTPVGDQELLRRYETLYPHPTPYQTLKLEVLKQRLEQGGDVEEWRRRNLALMNDVSQFMKLLKQRFTIWFNHAHDRYGTLWAERFKSVLVEGEKGLLLTMAAYIDLNAVRAGLVEDPKDYRFCGYAEAVGGRTVARDGIMSVVRGRAWAKVQASYRQILYATGADPREGKVFISKEAFRQVLLEQGQLSLPTVLRHRVRFFTDGAILGSKAFVQRHRPKDVHLPEHEPPEVPRWADWGELAILHPLRGPLH